MEGGDLQAGCLTNLKGWHWMYLVAQLVPQDYKGIDNRSRSIANTVYGDLNMHTGIHPHPHHFL